MSPRLVVSSAALMLVGSLLGCDGRQLVAPSLSADGDPSFVQGGSTLPEPTNATAVAISATELNLGWQDNSGNETRFEIEMSNTGEPGTFNWNWNSGANTVSVSYGGLTAATRYCYRIRAVRVEKSNKVTYSAYSNVACATTLAAAAVSPPSNLTAIRSGIARVDLSWNGNSQSGTGYYVHRSVDNGATWVTILTSGLYTPASPPPYPTSYSDTYAPNQRACYRVVSFSSIAESIPTPVVCADPFPNQPPPQLPAPASDVTAIPKNSSTVEVSWNGNNAGPTTYRAYRSIDNGASWTIFHTNTYDYSNYLIPYQLTATDNSVTDEQLVCYRVISSNSVGDAAPSARACTNTVNTPTNLTIARLDDATVEMHWTDASSVEDSYEIWGTVSTPYWCDGVCSADVGFGDFLIATLPANATSYTCTNCTVPYGDVADRNYLIRLSVVAIKGSYKSYVNSVTVP